MRSIFSVFAAGALILSLLAGCGKGRAGRVDEARITPSPVVTDQARPGATDEPKVTPNTKGNEADSAIGDLARGAENAVDDVVDGVKNAVDDAKTDGRDKTGAADTTDQK